MKNCVLTFFLFLSVLSSYSFSLENNPLSQETGFVPQEIIVLTNGEYPPYQSENLKFFGLWSRIVTESFALQGIKVEYQFRPWARALQEAKTGRCDGTFAWNKTPERLEKFYFSDPIATSDEVFFHFKSFPFDWQGVDDLGGVSIGGTTSYIYGELIDTAEAQGKIKIDRAISDEAGFRKLIAQRFKVFASNIDVGYDILNRQFEPQMAKLITHHPKPFHSPTYHLLLSKQNARNSYFIKAFNKGLAQLKKSGKYATYVAESRRGEYLKQ